MEASEKSLGGLTTEARIPPTKNQKPKTPTEKV
jgi:hypothetical protein